MDEGREVASLRRRNRWSLGIACLALAAAGLAVAGVVGSDGERVSARRFVLVDSAGEARGEFSLRADGPVLELGGGEGGRLALAAGASGPAVYLQGSDGTTRFQLSLRDGQPAVSLLDGSGRPRWIGAVTDGGNGVVRWMDSTGTVRLAAGADGEAGYSVQLYDDEGRNRATLAVDPGGAGFGLFGPGGRLLFP